MSTIDYKASSERRNRAYRIIRSQYEELYECFLGFIESVFKTYPQVESITLRGNTPYNDGDTPSFTLYNPIINDYDLYDDGWEDNEAEFTEISNEIEAYAEVLHDKHDSGWEIIFQRDNSTPRQYSFSIEDYYD